MVAPGPSFDEPRRKHFSRELLLANEGPSLPKVRALVGRLCQDVGFSPTEVYNIKVAVSEACSNAIEHGSKYGEANAATVRFRRHHRQSRSAAEKRRARIGRSSRNASRSSANCPALG